MNTCPYNNCREKKITMHLTEKQILLYLDNKILPGEKKVIENHLSKCGECSFQLANTYKLLKKVQKSKTPEPGKEYFERAKNLVPYINDESLRKGNRPRALIVFSAATAAAVVIIIFFNLINPGADTQNLYRSNKIIGDRVILFPPDNSVITTDSFTVNWIKVLNATAYNVSIYSNDGELLVNKVSADTMINLGSSNNFILGEDYLWKLEALLPDGRTIKSPVYSFKYLPE
jgi:hypothetical protein